MRETTPPMRRTGGSPRLRIMGEIDVSGTVQPLSDQQTAVIAVLQCCGPIGRSGLINALWDGVAISDQRVANLMAEVRAKIGREHLPDPVDGRYRLVGIQTDLHRFVDEIHSLTAAPQPLDAVGLTRLRRVTALVRGVPLSGRQGRNWAWLDHRPGLVSYAEATIADGAQQLSALAQGSGDTATATAALEAGLLGCPFDEALIGRLVELYINQRRPGTAARAVDAWERGIRRLDCGEPSPGPRKRLRAAARSLSDDQAVAIGSAVTTRLPR
ncbi:MAG: bacterial transcriptional activator domain-containing protein [Actinomycetota bacterium]